MPRHVDCSPLIMPCYTIRKEDFGWGSGGPVDATRLVGRCMCARKDSQIVEREQLGNTTEDDEYRNGEIHHATKITHTHTLALHTRQQCPPELQWRLPELLPSSGAAPVCASCSCSCSCCHSQDIGKIHGGGITGEMWEPHFDDVLRGDAGEAGCG